MTVSETTIGFDYSERERKMKFNIQTVVDENSINKLLENKDIPIDFKPQNIRWQIGEPTVNGDDIIVPIYAVGYNIIQRENQLSDEELRQALGQLSSKRLSDLCAEPIHTDCYSRPCLEIQPNCTPDWTPILHK